MSVKLLTEHRLEFLSLKGGYRGSSESTHVKMPHCWKYHAIAHYSEWCLTFQTPLGGHARKDIQDTGFRLTPCIALTKTGVLLMKQLQAQMIAKEPVRSTPQSALL